MQLQTKSVRKQEEWVIIRKDKLLAYTMSLFLLSEVEGLF
jgi:hypothetical protein